jgi:hypothetical protein
MELNAKKFYIETVRRLSPKERLRLAVMILNDLMESNEEIEFSDTWSDQDLKDLSAFALSHSENPHEQNKKNP